MIYKPVLRSDSQSCGACDFAPKRKPSWLGNSSVENRQALTGMGAFMALVGVSVRRKAGAGFGAMNEPCATEAICRAATDGDPL
jgi:hypothetical protein